ncbi:hypothetical protein ACJX0J_018515 [Zea mays]
MAPRRHGDGPILFYFSSFLEIVIIYEQTCIIGFTSSKEKKEKPQHVVSAIGHGVTISLNIRDLKKTQELTITQPVVTVIELITKFTFVFRPSLRRKKNDETGRISFGMAT